MRTLVLLLTICIGSCAFANSPTLFRDEDTGLVMRIPEGFKRTWQLSNQETGFDLTVFNTDEWEDNISLIGVIKVPTDSFDQDVEAIFPAMLEQMRGDLDTEFLESLCFNIFPIQSLAPEEYRAQGFRFNFYDKDEDETFAMDFHMFFETDCLCIVMTGDFPSEDFNSFSKGILQDVRFIKE